MNKTKLLLFTVICIAFAMSSADLYAQEAKSKRENSRYEKEETKKSEDEIQTMEETNSLRDENPPEAGTDEAIIFEATGGVFKTKTGLYYDSDLEKQVDFEADIIYISDDGDAEVRVTRFDSMYGKYGAETDLYLKDNSGNWTLANTWLGSLTFNKMKNKTKGRNDLRLSDPDCGPIWKWNGTTYELYKKGC